MAVFKQGPRPEDHYTMVANALARDKQLSLRAKGVYLFMRSHRDGWHMTVERIAKALGVAKDTVSKSIKELEEIGYIHREQAQGKDGKFSAIEYVILAEPYPRKPDTVLPDTVLPDTENWPPKEDYSFKKTKGKEDQGEEHTLAPASGRTNRRYEYPAEFEDWYRRYPKKAGKRHALKAWERAIKRVAPEELNRKTDEFAAFHAAEGTPKQFIKDPQGWLNGDKWDDELIPRQPQARPQMKTENTVEAWGGTPAQTNTPQLGWSPAPFGDSFIDHEETA